MTRLRPVPVMPHLRVVPVETSRFGSANGAFGSYPVSHLDRAYRRVSYAAYLASDFGDARHSLRLAVDDLRVAKAFDLARMVEKELAVAVDQPFCENILHAIDVRCTGRVIRGAI